MRLKVAEGQKKNFFFRLSETSSFSIFAGKGSEAEVVVANLAGEDKDVCLQVKASVSEGAKLRLVCCHLGGKEIESKIQIAQASGSACEHDEIAFLCGEQRLKVAAKHLHKSKGGRSRSSFRLAAAGGAQADAEGSVRILENAGKADARFEAKGILLSKEARIRFVPMLSVKSGEAAAAHAAAVEPLPEDGIFYLEARGIDGQEARRMMIAGFLLGFEAEQKAEVSKMVEEKIRSAEGLG